MQQHDLLLFISHQFAWNISRLRGTFRKCDYVLDYREWCSAYGLLREQPIRRASVNHTPATPPTVKYKFYPTTCQHFQQYVKLGRAFAAMLPWNIIIRAWLLKLLIKLQSTLSPQRMCCADLSASGWSRRSCRQIWSLWCRRTEERKTKWHLGWVRYVSGIYFRSQNRADCLCGLHKDKTTVIWPVQMLHHRLNVTLIYDFYLDYPCRILAYSKACASAYVCWCSTNCFFRWFSVVVLNLEIS